MRDRVAQVCAARTEHDTAEAESDFDKLLAGSKPLPEYGYDRLSTWRRGCERALHISRVLPGFDTLRSSLEVACGDGMASVALAAHGYNVMLADLRDWRDPRAATLPFKAVDLGSARTLPKGPHDLVFSYNAFEHFDDPERALQKMVAVTAPGGYLYFEFGPLYCGPWGLHAYRMFPIPYMQFLFSDDFWRKKINQSGVRDLGQQLEDLQPLNRWTARQFSALWTRSGCKVIKSSSTTIEHHLDVVLRYPRSFQGRGLTLEDLSTQALTVLLQKPE
jgi:SAM-dependent methyltransferase